MILFYNNLKDREIPYAVTPVQFTDIKDAKSRLIEYYKENEGKDSIDVVIYDCVIDDNTTLVDVLHKFVNFEFVTIWIISPIKIYSFDKVSEVNAILQFSRDMNTYVERLRPHMKINVIDDVQYFFVGFKFG